MKTTGFKILVSIVFHHMYCPCRESIWKRFIKYVLIELGLSVKTVFKSIRATMGATLASVQRRVIKSIHPSLDSRSSYALSKPRIYLEAFH